MPVSIPQSPQADFVPGEPADPAQIIRPGLRPLVQPANMDPVAAYPQTPPPAEGPPQPTALPGLPPPPASALAPLPGPPPPTPAAPLSPVVAPPTVPGRTPPTLAPVQSDTIHQLLAQSQQQAKQIEALQAQQRQKSLPSDPAQYFGPVIGEPLAKTGLDWQGMIMRGTIAPTERGILQKAGIDSRVLQGFFPTDKPVDALIAPPGPSVPPVNAPDGPQGGGLTQSEWNGLYQALEVQPQEFQAITEWGQRNWSKQHLQAVNEAVNHHGGNLTTGVMLLTQMRDAYRSATIGQEQTTVPAGVMPPAPGKVQTVDNAGLMQLQRDQRYLSGEPAYSQWVQSVAEASIAAGTLY